MNDLFEYKESLDTLHYTEIQKEQIAAAAVNTAKQYTHTHHKKHQPVLRVAIAAACISALLITGAAATGVLKDVTTVFGPIFGTSEAQTEIINKIGHPIGASDTDDGITIAADAVIGDKYNGCIVYTISRDDGSPLLPDGVTVNQLSSIFGGADISAGFGGTHGSRGFRDSETNDNAVQYVQYISADNPLKTGVVPVEFSGLSYYDAEGTKHSLSNGTWKFNFDFNYEDCSVTLTTDETFSQYGMTYSISEVTVSPIAVQVAYEVDREIVWSNAPSGEQPESDSRQMQRYFETVSIILQKTDGTEIDMSNAGGSISPKDGKTICTKGEILPEIIPLEELKAITVGGITLVIPN